MRRHLVAQLLFTTLLVATFCHLIRENHDILEDYTGLSWGFLRPLEKQVLDLSHLTGLNITDSFTYARRTIITTRDPDLHPRPLMTVVDEDLYSRLITVDQLAARTDMVAINIPPSLPLRLNVPMPRALRAESLSFGIATTIERLNSSIAQFQHWLPGSGAQLHVVVPDGESIKPTEEVMKSVGIDVCISTASDTFAVNYFKHIKLLYERRTPKTKWIALIDDDTFFPSLPDLVFHLTSRYNHREPFLVAPISDDLGQVLKHGLMPFGGGGVFLSLPLVEQLIQPETFDSCLQTDKFEGDQIVADCVSKHTMVKPSFDFGLHQMDLKGDVGGFYESGREPLSLHHWKSWHMTNLTAMAEVSKACGNNCMLQRWRFSDDTVLSNGYSIVKYPTLHPDPSSNPTDFEEHPPLEIDFQAMEKTWDGEMERFEHSHSPLRSPLIADVEKVSFILLSSKKTDNAVLQTYGHVDHDAGLIDGILELEWLR